MSRSRLEAFSDGVIAVLATPWAAIAVYAGVAVVWLVPDRRFERAVAPPPDAGT